MTLSRPRFPAIALGDRRGGLGRMVRQSFLLAGGLIVAGLLLAGPALAHASVMTSSPLDGARLRTAPRIVTITFDEPVSLGSIGYLHVTDARGERVDAAAAFHPAGRSDVVADRVRPGLSDGSYLASYRVISADTHPVAGSIAFVVGHGTLLATGGAADATDRATGATLVLARWVSYVGLALLGGTWLPLTVWPAGLQVRRTRRLVALGATLLASGTVAEFLLQGAYAAGESVAHAGQGASLDTTVHSAYGVLLIVRLGLLVVLGAVLIRRVTARATGGAARVLLGVPAVALPVTFALTGHPSTTHPAWLSEAADVLHLLAMALWVGGLAVLTLVLLPRRDPAELGPVLRVFSPVAFGCVAVLAVTGTYAAWRGIGTWSAVLGTTYGLLVVGKVVLFLGLVGLGNLSRGVVRRRWARPVALAMTDTARPLALPVAPDAGGPSPQDEAGGDVTRLRRSVLLEVLVALVVLALTAVLVAQPRGTEALAARYRGPQTVDAPLTNDSTLGLTADPDIAGPTQLTVTLPAGSAARSVTATATQPQRQLGPLTVPLRRLDVERWQGTVTLPVSGNWQVDLVVSTSAFDAVTTEAVLNVH